MQVEKYFLKTMLLSFTPHCLMSKVRLKNGKIIRVNPSEIVKVAQNIADTFNKDDLKLKKD